MTSLYLQQLATIAANDFVSAALLFAAALIVAALFFSGSITLPRLRRSVQITALAVCFCTYFALLISPLLGVL